MAIHSEHPKTSAASAVASRDALSEVVNSVGNRLATALAQTPRAQVLESRRQIERVLGRNLEPRFAVELLTLLLARGSSGRELRNALGELLNMIDTPAWVPAPAPAPLVMTGSDDELKFLASEEAACVQDFARCGPCLASSAWEHKRESLAEDEAARLQWALCAQCRSGTADWYRG